ncbi:hypothetical protein CSAL01_12583 [Colletotrichum salicis]|uniref:Uncharacterized protein n=1 Tax=Colletotrichum salicis TaxID=1209931 RepID=A0A135UGH7_9PEZI|nr:hypothetical protein CSAL01_12583 [Colletotrichum salicis]
MILVHNGAEQLWESSSMARSHRIPCRIPTSFRTSLSLSLSKQPALPPPYRTDHWETALGFAAPQAAASALLRFCFHVPKFADGNMLSSASRQARTISPSGDFLARSSAMPFPALAQGSRCLCHLRLPGAVAAAAAVGDSAAGLTLAAAFAACLLRGWLRYLCCRPCYRPIIASLHRAADAMPYCSITAPYSLSIFDARLTGPRDHRPRSCMSLRASVPVTLCDAAEPVMGDIPHPNSIHPIPSFGLSSFFTLMGHANMLVRRAHSADDRAPLTVQSQTTTWFSFIASLALCP